MDEHSVTFNEPHLSIYALMVTINSMLHIESL